MPNLLQHLQQLAGNTVHNIEHPSNISDNLLRLLTPSQTAPPNPLTTSLRQPNPPPTSQIKLLPGTAAATYNGVPYSIPHQATFPLSGNYRATINDNPSRYSAIPYSMPDELAQFPKQTPLTPIGQ